MQRRLIAIALAATLLGFSAAQAQPLKKATISVGTSVLTVAYPMVKGVDEATALRWDLNSISQQLMTLQDGFKLNGGKQWGYAEADNFARLQSFLQEADLIKGSLPANTFLANFPGFYDRVNEFDIAKVREAARKCETN
ncbi:MAG: hypothetical protein ISP49_15960 [Reyranella sp.]|nr:hypothetical protein [Reyranella sp.]MBL6653091.1 hypothetical protein [Reyranella sp.]